MLISVRSLSCQTIDAVSKRLSSSTPMESAAASWILLLIGPFAKIGNGDSLRKWSYVGRHENEGGAVFVGIANSIFWALCNSFVFF